MRERDVTRWRRQVLASSVSNATKVVAMVLHEHMDWDGPEAGGNCWPALSTLEAEAGQDRRTVTRGLGALVDAGYLERACRRGCRDCRGGNGHVMTYTAQVPDPSQQGRDATAEQGRQATAETSDVHSAGATGHRNSGIHALSRGDTPPLQGREATQPSHDLPEGPTPDHPVAADATTTWPDGWSASHPKVDRYSSVLHRLRHRLGDDWPIVAAEGPHLQKLRNAAARAAAADVDPYELARVVTAKPLDGLTSYAAGLARRIDDALPTVRKAVAA